MGYRMTAEQEFTNAIFGLPLAEEEEVRIKAGEQQCSACKKWVPREDLVEAVPSPRHPTIDDCLLAIQRKLR